MIGHIYLLTFPNGKGYVGETAQSVEERVERHQYDADRGCSYLVHKAMRKYGINSFVVRKVITLQCTQEYLDLIEDRAIEYFGTLAPVGYNLRRGGRHGTPTEEVRAKLSLARKGKHPSPETKAKISASLMGRVRSEEHKAKISMANKGRVLPPRSTEHCMKLSAARKGTIGNMLGKHHTEEAKAKISAAQKSRPRAPRAKKEKE